MFGRSQSGPSGLSINTNQANSLSAPTNSQPQASGGLFSDLQKEKPSTGLFGSSLATTQPQQSTGLFGSTNQPPPQNTGLFGSRITSQPQQNGAPADNSTSNQAGLLFGGSSMTSQQKPGGGLFGAQQTNQPATNLFGSANAQSQPQQQQGGLFASLGQNQNQQKPQIGGLFGGALGKDQNASTFAPTQMQAQGQQPNQQPSIFATSIGQFTQRQQPVPGVRVTTSELRPTTRFTDLHEHLQTFIENIDDFIQQQMKFQQECIALNPTIEEDCKSMPTDVDFCTKALDTMQNALENDAGAIFQAKSLTKDDVSNAKLCFSAVENMALPQQYQANNLWALPSVSRDSAPSLLDDDDTRGLDTNASLVALFSNQSDAMSKSLDDYRRNVADIESYLKGIEAGTLQQMQQLFFTRGRDGSDKNAEDQIRELAAVLKEFDNGILNVAGKVGGVRENMQEVILGDHRAQTERSRRLGLLL
ncbi:MAG: hypothetical protein Q9216_004125 [Gyalolechia sp. 2 TL-2023]